METIWKFSLRKTLRQTLIMPQGATVLDVQEQNGNVCLWALVDPNAPSSSITIAIRGTGDEIEDEVGEHISTFQTGPYVWHVFKL